LLRDLIDSRNDGWSVRLAVEKAVDLSEIRNAGSGNVAVDQSGVLSSGPVIASAAPSGVDVDSWQDVTATKRKKPGVSVASSPATGYSQQRGSGFATAPAVGPSAGLNSSDARRRGPAPVGGSQPSPKDGAASSKPKSDYYSRGGPVAARNAPDTGGEGPRFIITNLLWVC
jgi:hypothetical protein